MADHVGKTFLDPSRGEIYGIHFVRLFKANMRERFIALMLGMLTIGVITTGFLLTNGYSAASEPQPQVILALAHTTSTSAATFVPLTITPTGATEKFTSTPTITPDNLPDDEEIVIGELKWELKDNMADLVLDKGILKIHPGDVTITRGLGMKGDIFYSKGIVIGETDFYLGTSSYVRDTPSTMTGFGMYLNRTDMPSFSWDWFTVEDAHRAKKLQGAGELDFSGEVINSEWDMTHMEFLTDVVFRCYLLEGDDADSDTPRWTLTVFAESYINWPHFNSIGDSTPTSTPMPRG